jgi:hypothetical protein
MPLSSPTFSILLEFIQKIIRQKKVERLKLLISLPGILMMFSGTPIF